MVRLISDPHFHLWSPDSHSWLKNAAGLKNHPAGDITSVGRTYDIKEFVCESQKYKLDKSVHIQCYDDNPLQETAKLQAIADSLYSKGHPHGIIAYAELESDDIQQTLEKHMAFPNFRGIRQCLDFHPKYENRRLCPDSELMFNPKFYRGLRFLQKHGLIFDMQLYPTQMLNAVCIACAHPALKIVVNHCGFPLLEDIAVWKKGIELLSKCNNVCMKLSGWSIVDQAFNVQSMEFIVAYVLQHFDCDRVMFASDFPVDKPHQTYDEYWDMYCKILQKLNHSEVDIEKMLHLNAIKVYELDGTNHNNNTGISHRSKL